MYYFIAFIQCKFILTTVTPWKLKQFGNWFNWIFTIFLKWFFFQIDLDALIEWFFFIKKSSPADLFPQSIIKPMCIHIMQWKSCNWMCIVHKILFCITCTSFEVCHFCQLHNSYYACKKIIHIFLGCKLNWVEYF